MRKCENWLGSFLEWTADRSIAPMSVLSLCGLFSLSSIARRNVKLSEKYLGGWNCYPHLYVVFVAPPGVITKSTSIGFTETLLRELNYISLSPSIFTTAKLGELLSESPDASLSCIVSEFGLLVDKAGSSIYSVLIDLFDGKLKYDEATIGRGRIEVVNPVVNYMAATTPDWMRDNMTPQILSGGYGSRTLHIYEDVPREPKLLHHKNKNNNKDYTKLKEDLIHDLNYISENISGEFELVDGADDWLESWYQETLKLDTLKVLKGYAQRRPAYAIKFAMLFSLAIRDELILDIDILEKATAFLSSLETKMLAALGTITKNKYSADIMEIIQYVEEVESVERSELFRMFVGNAEPGMLEALLKMAEDMGKIRMKMKEGKVYYVSTN